MSARIFGGKATLSGSIQSITDLVASVETGFTDTTFSILTIRADLDNAGPLFIGQSDVDGTTRAHSILQPGEALSIDCFSSIHTNNLSLFGTSSDQVFILGVEY